MRATLLSLTVAMATAIVLAAVAISLYAAFRREILLAQQNDVRSCERQNALRVVSNERGRALGQFVRSDAQARAVEAHEHPQDARIDRWLVRQWRPLIPAVSTQVPVVDCQRAVRTAP